MSKQVWALRSAGVLAAGYALSLAAIWARQEKMLFKPDPFSKLAQTLRALRAGRSLGRRVREWEHNASDGKKIQAFVSMPVGRERERLPALIYLGGIREETSWALPLATHFPNRAFVCINYRGYGTSEGNPSEKEILSDCESALREMSERGQIALEDCVLVGRSLGSGVAGYLCDRIQAKGCCLVTPYDSVMAVARRKYWYLPVALIFRHAFNAVPWAKRNTAPMMMVLSEVDLTVPHAHSGRLFDAWAGEKIRLTLDQTDHSSVAHDERLFPLIAEFVKRFDAQQTALAEPAAAQA